MRTHYDIFTRQDEEAADKMDIGGGGPPSRDKANMSAKEIDELLKRGAYDVFREDDSDQREFEEADIDSILERRARKVDLTGGKGISASLGKRQEHNSTVQYSTVQYSTVQYSTVQYRERRREERRAGMSRGEESRREESRRQKNRQIWCK